MDRRCQVFKIDKGNGSFRLIYSPNEKYKKYLKSLIPAFEKELDKMDTDNIFHAFRTGKNVVTNAMIHIGWKYSAKFDLKSFFDHVKQKMVPHVNKKCFIGGITRQGLPTSPVIASMAFLPIAYNIKEQLSQFDCAMSVYADDITVSFNNRSEFYKIRDIVYETVNTNGFKVNLSKTKLMFGHKKGMRRIICGVGVDETGIHPTRASRRRQETASNNGETAKMVGLMEWNSLKVPNKHTLNTSFQKNKEKYKKRKTA